MASGGPVKELCEEATCSICLDLFRDPVTVAECGHNFCRACLTQSWGEATVQEASCPQCRAPSQEGSLRPNQQLASFVEILKRCSPAEGKEAEGQGAKGGEEGGSMCEKHGEPLRLFCREDEAPLCLVCSKSREHRGHLLTPLEEAAPQKEQTVVEARKESVCQKHQEPLKLFCKDDEAPICVVCEQSREHRYHEIFPLGEASQEYKDQFCDCVKVLREERDKILAYKDNIVKESQDLLSQTKGERQKTMIIFRQLQKFLEEQEELLLAQMEEAEKEILRRKDRHLDELTGALSFLESIIREMEEKCQQPASDLLQDARSTQNPKSKSKSGMTATPTLTAKELKAMDAMDKKLEKIEKKIMEAMKEGFKEYLKDVKTLMLDLKDELRKDITEAKEEMKKDVDQAKADLTKKMVDFKKDSDKKSAYAEKKAGNVDMMLQYRVTESYLRFRGIEEVDDEVTKTRMAEILAEYLQKGQDEIESKIDLAYRVRSEYAQRKQLPRDIIVQFMAKYIKEDILWEHFRNPLSIGNKKIIIMKVIPRQMVEESGAFKNLTDKLKKKGIRFRWEVPVGITFTFNNMKWTLSTVEQNINSKIGIHIEI